MLTFTTHYKQLCDVAMCYILQIQMPKIWGCFSTPMHPLVYSLVLVCLGGRAYSNAYFGAGSGPIFLDDVQCTFSSSQLLECPSRPILSHNCLHSADAGVGCEGMSYHWLIQAMLHTTLYCKFHVLYYKSHVQLGTCDWQEVTYQMKAEWRSA